jgi:hypothetical protein
MYSEFRDSAICSKIGVWKQCYSQFYRTTDTSVSQSLEVIKIKVKKKIYRVLQSNHFHLQAEEVAIDLFFQSR